MDTRPAADSPSRPRDVLPRAGATGWRVAKLGRTSAATGEPLPPDAEVVTALFGSEAEDGSTAPGAAQGSAGDVRPRGARAGEEGELPRGAGLVRMDFLPDEATPAALEGAFCVWRTRTPPADAAAARRLDLDLARTLLERLLQETGLDAEAPATDEATDEAADEASDEPSGDGDPRAAVAFVLALLLARKRRLTIVEELRHSLLARWPREEATFRVPAPPVSAEDADRLQEDLLRLLDL